MKVIFLDIDGVLNCRTTTTRIAYNGFDGFVGIDPALVKNLNKLVEATKAEIVLSSTWREVYGLENTEKEMRLRGYSGPKLIGKTPALSFMSRGFEIQAWLDGEMRRNVFSDPNYKPTFVILDDNDMGRDHPLNSKLVRTNENVGLTEEKVDEAVGMLNGIVK